tara:strand:+ start:184 stop:525 length:342 start_codon:yes stop_codon:yes gene_type:complete
VTIYIKINDGNIATYPYTYSSLYSENPNTLYDDRYDLRGWFNQTETCLVEGHVLEEVVEADSPVIDPTTEKNVISDEPTLVDGVWTLGVTTVPLSAPEIYAYQKFLELEAESK